MPTDFYLFFPCSIRGISLHCWYFNLLIPHPSFSFVFIYIPVILFLVQASPLLPFNPPSHPLPTLAPTFGVDFCNKKLKITISFFVPFGLKLIFTVLWRVGGKQTYLSQFICKLCVVLCVCWCECQGNERRIEFIFIITIFCVFWFLVGIAFILAHDFKCK